MNSQIGPEGHEIQSKIYFFYFSFVGPLLFRPYLLRDSPITQVQFVSDWFWIEPKYNELRTTLNLKDGISNSLQPSRFIQENQTLNLLKPLDKSPNFEPTVCRPKTGKTELRTLPNTSSSTKTELRTCPNSPKIPRPNSIR